MGVAGNFPLTKQYLFLAFIIIFGLLSEKNSDLNERFSHSNDKFCYALLHFVDNYFTPKQAKAKKIRKNKGLPITVTSLFNNNN